MPNVEFGDIKAAVPLETVAFQMLGISLQTESTNNDGEKYYKGTCPICNSSKAFTLTIGRGWYCFGRCRIEAQKQGRKSGGDAIKLVAAVRRIEPRAAALAIQEHFGSTSRTVQRARDSGNTDRATQLARVLERLQPEHETIQSLGISPETARLFESGYNASGVQAKRYSVAVRDLAGNLVTFAGIATSEDQTPAVLFSNFGPESAIFNQHRLAEGTELLIFRSALDAILAVESGAPIDSVAAFLTETVSPSQLDLLQHVMLERQIGSLLL